MLTHEVMASQSAPAYLKSGSLLFPARPENETIVNELTFRGGVVSGVG